MGQVTPPSSKSHNVRALFFALLAQGKSSLTNALLADDTHDALRICRALGAHIDTQSDPWHIEAQGLPLRSSNTVLDIGNSGLTGHFALPLLGLRADPEAVIHVDSGAQMRLRPIGPLVEALRTLGMSIDYLEQTGHFPLRVSGRLLGGHVQVSGMTSQYASALLMALPCAQHDSELTVVDLCERPYLELSLQWLQQLDIYYQHQRLPGRDVFTVPGKQCYSSFTKTMVGDFSSASYLIAAAVLLPGRVAVLGLDMNDAQGDKRLVALLQQMDAAIDINSDCLLIHGGKPLTAIDIDASDIPDLVPTLAVVATQARGCTNITHVSHARIKETDRLHSMTQGLRGLGADIREHEAGLTIHSSSLCGAEVQGYGDHRTVMALSIAGLIAQGTTRISDAQAIHKTFPDFITQLQSLGATLELDHA